MIARVISRLWSVPGRVFTPCEIGDPFRHARRGTAASQAHATPPSLSRRCPLTFVHSGNSFILDNRRTPIICPWVRENRPIGCRCLDGAGAAVANRGAASSSTTTQQFHVPTFPGLETWRKLGWSGVQVFSSSCPAISPITLAYGAKNANAGTASWGRVDFPAGS